MTTYEARPSVTEKASIQNKCINYIYDCGEKCTTQTVSNFKSLDREERQLKRIELEKCMTHYQENLRSKFFNSGEYKNSKKYEKHYLDIEIAAAKKEADENELTLLKKELRRLTKEAEGKATGNK